MTFSRTAVFAALVLCILCPSHVALAASAYDDVRVAADDQTQNDGGNSKASAPKSGDSAPTAEDPSSPMHQCKIGCNPSCNIFGNADLAQQCIESCEAKCDATYGK